jgi:hypothetical protein
LDEDLMKLKLDTMKQLVWLAAPVVAFSAIAPAPTQAATLSSSTATVNLYNFSHEPLSVAALIDSDKETNATNGNVAALGTATADFQKNPAKATNFSSSTAGGDGFGYTGSAQSFAGVIGYNFQVAKGQTFSFGFDAALNLSTSIDDPSFESANAAGGIAFFLFDASRFDVSKTDPSALTNFDFSDIRKGAIASFLLTGNVITPGDEDFLIDVTRGSGFQSASGSDKDFDGNQEGANFATQGLFSRKFNQDMNLTLVEVKGNYASVTAVPSPTLIPGFLISSAVVAVRRRLKAKKAKSLSEKSVKV